MQAAHHWVCPGAGMFSLFLRMILAIERENSQADQEYHNCYKPNEISGRRQLVFFFSKYKLDL